MIVVKGWGRWVELGDVGQRVRTSSYKMNKLWGSISLPITTHSLSYIVHCTNIQGIAMPLLWCCGFSSAELRDDKRMLGDTRLLTFSVLQPHIIIESHSCEIKNYDMVYFLPFTHALASPHIITCGRQLLHQDFAGLQHNVIYSLHLFCCSVLTKVFFHFRFLLF